MMDNEISTIYRCTFPKLLRFYRNSGCNYQQAEDLAQDVFLKLLEHRQEVIEELVIAYIWTIARNLLIDHSRLKKGRIYLDDISSASAPYELSEFMVGIGLSEKDRNLLIMKAFGLTYDELAQVNGLGRTAVKRQVGRARERLGG
jgi:DNA-directed RNA polymerase specialized sigma24 family protein